MNNKGALVLLVFLVLEGAFLLCMGLTAHHEKKVLHNTIEYSNKNDEGE